VVVVVDAAVEVVMAVAGLRSSSVTGARKWRVLEARTKTLLITMYKKKSLTCVLTTRRRELAFVL